MEETVLFLELAGTIAFAVSGALKAIRHGTDLFGVIILGVITATGGGILRDVILGATPPAAFTDPLYVIVSFFTAAAVFAWHAGRGHGLGEESRLYVLALFIMDSFGLGIFTASGILAAYAEYSENTFLCVFSGVLTGTGGGLIRDICVNELPYIFSRHIYAMASIAGALCGIPLLKGDHTAAAVFVIVAVILVIRSVSAYYHLDLPKISEEE